MVLKLHVLCASLSESRGRAHCVFECSCCSVGRWSVWAEMTTPTVQHLFTSLLSTLSALPKQPGEFQPDPHFFSTIIYKLYKEQSCSVCLHLPKTHNNALSKVRNVDTWCFQLRCIQLCQRMHNPTALMKVNCSNYSITVDPFCDRNSGYR